MHLENDEIFKRTQLTVLKNTNEPLLGISVWISHRQNLIPKVVGQKTIYCMTPFTKNCSIIKKRE